jgi:hypothetical protein
LGRIVVGDAMNLLESLLLLALVVGAVYHWIVRVGLKCRIGDLEWELGNQNDQRDLGKRRDREIHDEIKQLKHDLEQYKTSAYEWETRFNACNADADVLIERIRKAKAALK